MTSLVVPPIASVVVATRNRQDRLDRLMKALSQQSLGPASFEVIVVDDASGDGTARILDRWCARSPFRMSSICLERHSGPATARNAGWRAARAPLIAFTDDDCEPSPAWLKAGVEALQADPGAFAQGPTEPLPSELDSFGPFSHTISVRELDASFPTCNVLYRRDLLERLGGFDESFPGAGGEDCDLAWRAKSAGARPVFVPGALVHHAVVNLGPLGKLRRAASWTSAMTAYARHKELRRAVFVHGIFWKRIHYMLACAIAGALLPSRPRWSPLRNWLMYPYLQDVWARGRLWGGGLFLAPYYVLHDVIEMLAVARASIRHRKLML